MKYLLIALPFSCLLAVFFGHAELEPKAMVDSDMMTILFAEGEPDQRIAVLDLSDAELVRTYDSKCEIRNLTAKLALVDYISIEEIDGGKMVQVLMSGGLIDSIPYYPNSGDEQSKVARAGILRSEFSATDLIRINGKTITLKEASAHYRELGKKPEEIAVATLR